MKKSFLRPLALTLMLAALVAAPLKSFADDSDPIVSGGDPTPTLNALSMLPLVLSLATQ